MLVSAQEHGPPTPGPGGLARDCRRAHLGARVADSLHRSDSDGANALAAQSVGTAVDRVRPEAQGVADTGQQRRGHPGVAGRRRVEPVVAEHLVREPGELRAEQVAQGDGAATGLDDGDGLGCGQVATPAAGQQSQRLGHRLDGAQVGTRSDDDLAVGGAKGADGLFEVTDRNGLVDAVGDVVGADQDDGDVRVGDLVQRGGELRVQARGLRRR